MLKEDEESEGGGRMGVSEMGFNFNYSPSTPPQLVGHDVDDSVGGGLKPPLNNSNLEATSVDQALLCCTAAATTTTNNNNIGQLDYLSSSSLYFPPLFSLIHTPAAAAAATTPPPLPMYNYNHNLWEWAGGAGMGNINNRRSDIIMDGGGEDTMIGGRGVSSISAAMNMKMKMKMKMKKIKGRRKVREPRFSFKTMSDVDVLDDGYKWRKYGQKVVKNTLHPRSYYRCTQEKCRVKKRVERLAEDPRMVITTYEGRHVHSPSNDLDDSQTPQPHHLNNFFW